MKKWADLLCPTLETLVSRLGELATHYINGGLKLTSDVRL